MKKAIFFVMSLLLVGCHQESPNTPVYNQEQQSSFDLKVASESCALQAKAWGQDNPKHALECKKKSNIDICLKHFSAEACHAE